MSDARHESRENAPWGMWTATLLLFSPLIYVLSIGPVVALVEHGLLPMEPTRAFYGPVIWMHENTPLARPLEWYGALWGW